MGNARVSHQSQTKTFHLANSLSQFPRVEDTAQVDLHDTRFHEQTHRASPKKKGFLKKCVEMVNPSVWTPAFWFVLICLVGLNYLAFHGIKAILTNIKAPLYAPNSILSVLRASFIWITPTLLLVFHLCLNYRLRGPGRLIKAYWYASWVGTFCLGLNGSLVNAVAQLEATQINEHCFVNKNSKTCEKFLQKTYKSALCKNILKLMPERKRLALSKLFDQKRKTEMEARAQAEAESEESSDETPENKVTPKKVAAAKVPDARKRLARSLENTRRLAYTH